MLPFIESLGNRVKLVNRVTWQKTEPYNSVNLLRLIGLTPLFRLIGSKWSGPDVTLLIFIFCMYYYHGNLVFSRQTAHLHI